MKGAHALTQRAVPTARSPLYIRICHKDAYGSIFQNGKHKEKDKNQANKKQKRAEEEKEEINYFWSLKNKRIITTPRDTVFSYVRLLATHGL